LKQDTSDTLIRQITQLANTKSASIQSTSTSRPDLEIDKGQLNHPDYENCEDEDTFAEEK